MDSDSGSDSECYGPALPPSMQKRPILGPQLPPPDFQNKDESEVKKEIQKTHSESEDDEEVFGPVPLNHPAAQSRVQIALENRARRVQENFSNKVEDKNKREEWMTELPEAHALKLGLDSIKRKFRATEGPDMSDRSMWSDTPADRLRKQREKEENRFVPSEESTSKKAKKSKSEKRDCEEEEKRESLLDIHLKNMSKSKKKMEKQAKRLGLTTRRPFDRDVDLQTNVLDGEKKKKIFEKASKLNDRFTVGKM
ncbi:hypothetical protein TKK_0005169 [Trichogramma kaykai]|uniref:DUF3752 domain-containing protein n=1 Tax=Trichogramma kaykai TaxID=54128 RepID=A0ABD2XKS7_9HYME